jgi:DNA-damage-inducible protein D
MGESMSDQNTTSSPFEAIRHMTEEDGAEYWTARELAEVLGYAKWANFAPTIKDAQKACEGSGYTVSDHFLEVRKMVTLGSGAQRGVQDFHLSRYACYLVVQNADPGKPIVALGQTYFAVRTREAELAEEAALAGMSEDQLRLHIRQQLLSHNRELAEAAQAVGVPSTGFAAFQDHGYRGLYNGETARAIAARKGLARGQRILDWMNSDELAANQFRASLTQQKLRNDPTINSKDAANRAHHQMGADVRQFIIEHGGTPPEQLPKPPQSIQQIQREEQARVQARRQPSLFPPDAGDTGE